MCYSIPGRIIELKSNIAVIDYFGEKRKALNEFNFNVGDYVYAQGGVLINKISEKEARQILNIWKERFFELKKIDSQLARVKKSEASANLLRILQKVNLSVNLSQEELISLLKIKKSKLLCDAANNIRQKEHGNASCVHGIIEFSNYCTNDCFYCGIRKSRNIERYRLSIEEIVEIALYASKELGFKALVLQSGEDSWYDERKLIRLVKEIRKLDVLIFLSVGNRELSLYQKLYDAGARAALLRFETSNKKIFEKLRPHNSYEKRIELIKNIKKLGYVLATGFLVGLPDENEHDIINSILLTKSLKPDMYSFGPLIPTKSTPLENQKKIYPSLMLKLIAIIRLIDKKSNILVTTSLETLDKNAKRLALLSGANSMMLNVTPEKFRRLYNIYDNRAGINDKVQDSIKETIDMLYSLGRTPADL